jgi:malate permease and related proteins
MKLLIDIFLVVTLPIIALIVVGYGVQTRLPEARKVLSYVYTNVVLPSFMIYFISTTTLPLDALWPVVWFTVLQSAVIGAAGWLLALSLGVASEVRPVVAIGGVFANTGNFGVPLAILAFPPEYTTQQAIIAAITAILFVPLCTLVLAPAAERKSWGAVAVTVATNPIVLGVAAGLALRIADLQLPTIIAKPLQMLSAAYTAIALMSLGAALHGGAIDFTDTPLRATLVMKLLIAPLLTWLLAYLLGFGGTTLALFVVAASMPTAALVGVIAAQSERGPRTATSAVFISTLLAPLVVTAWIFAMRYFSP